MRNLLIFPMLALAAHLAAPVAAAEPRAERAERAESYVPPTPKPGYSYPECYCTDSRGARVEVGELACLQIGGRNVLSRCEKARNLVIWRHQSDGCAPGV
ncbi:MAG: hypothetical protein ACFBRM_07740 [Pikeienuella sp.]